MSTKTKNAAQKNVKATSSKAIASKSSKKATAAKSVKVAKKAATKVVKTTTKVAAKTQPTNGNPYRVGGGYHASVEGLKALGIGKMHSFESILKAVRKAMGEAAWKAFAAKDARNGNGKDANARAIQNVSVVARKPSKSSDYAKPLREAGLIVKFDGRAKQAGLFKI